MKFRTDFVTNSSDSSFLVFNIKNKRLFEALTSLGIKFKYVEEGEFSDKMLIELPSGATEIFDETGGLPYPDDMDFISAWLVSTILWQVVADCPPQFGEDSYSGFTKELIDILNKADITHLDWEVIEKWSEDEFADDLKKTFGIMDGEIEEANIENAFGFEGVADFCLYTEVKDGKRMSANYFGGYGIKEEDCEGQKFVVTGKLKFFENRDKIVEFIEGAGGSVTDTVSKNTDYLVCNDVKSNSSKMKKAKELGITVLSEAAFIRRFGNPEDFEGFIDLNGLNEKAWDVTHDGGVLDLVVDSGIMPIAMEIWEDGRWVRNVSATKKRAKDDKIEATKKIMADIWVNADARLKRLILIPTRDCLSATDIETTAKIESMSFELLCEKGYIRFEDGPIDAFEAQDCYICVEKETDCNELRFTVICNKEIEDMEDYRIRHLEIVSVLNEMLQGKEIAGFGKMYYSFCLPADVDISDDYEGLTIWFSDEESTECLEILDYAPINKAIVHTLLSDTEFMAAMEVEGKTEAVLYSQGYFKMHKCYTQNLNKRYRVWLLIKGNFLCGDFHETCVDVCVVCRADARKTSNGDDRLEVMAERIKADLKNLSIVGGDKLQFDDPPYYEGYESEFIISKELVGYRVQFNII